MVNCRLLISSLIRRRHRYTFCTPIAARHRDGAPCRGAVCERVCGDGVQGGWWRIADGSGVNPAEGPWRGEADPRSEASAGLSVGGRGGRGGGRRLWRAVTRPRPRPPAPPSARWVPAEVLVLAAARCETRGRCAGRTFWGPPAARGSGRTAWSHTEEGSTGTHAPWTVEGDGESETHVSMRAAKTKAAICSWQAALLFRRNKRTIQCL